MSPLSLAIVLMWVEVAFFLSLGAWVTGWFFGRAFNYALNARLIELVKLEERERQQRIERKRWLTGRVLCNSGLRRRARLARI